MREQNSSVFSDPNGAILKELYELKQLVIQQGQAQKRCFLPRSALSCWGFCLLCVPADQ